MKVLLVIVAIAFAGSALAAAGCPPGTKQHCVQGKGGVVCKCR